MVVQPRRAVGDQTVGLYATKFAAPVFGIWPTPRTAGRSDHCEFTLDSPTVADTTTGHGLRSVQRRGAQRVAASRRCGPDHPSRTQPWSPSDTPRSLDPVGLRNFSKH